MTCPCGCGGAVKPGNTYAARGCSSRVYWRRLGSPQARAGFLRRARARHGISTPQLRRWGAEGGKASGVARRRAAVERFSHLPKAEAIVAAARWAMAMQRQRKWRAQVTPPTAQAQEER